MVETPTRARPPLLETVATRLDAVSGAIDRLVSGDAAAILVREVFARSEIDELVGRLREHGSRLPTFQPPLFKGRVLGKPLVAAAEGLADYVEQAERFRQECARIFPEYPDLEGRLGAVIETLAGSSVTSMIPRWTDGRLYLAASVRVLIEGDSLPLHYENETLDRPVMGELRPLLDDSTLMSFYVPMVLPSQGGELRLFDTSCLNGGDSLVERLGGEQRALPQFESTGYRMLSPGIGDLLVFDGGRWYHDVTAVQRGERWTLGGFLAASRNRDTVYYWS